jgi:hypothetical protein
MPFCNKCGTEVAEGINFCGKCGNALNSAQSPSQTNYAASGISGGTPFVMGSKMLFRIIGKLGYIFVVIGFCMPIACDKNGFDVANFFMDSSNFRFSGGSDKTIFGFLMILMFITAVVGIIIGIVQLTNKNVKNITIDWITTIVCIGSGLIAYIGCLVGFVDGKYIKLQSGAYVILIGWIIALVGQIISTFSLDSSNQKPAVSELEVQELSDKWVWLYSVTPILATILGFAGDGMKVVSICFSLAIIILLMTLDVRELKRRGFNLGVWFWLCYILPPIYLFVRAARTNKKYGYAITYWILYILSVVVVAIWGVNQVNQ